MSRVLRIGPYKITVTYEKHTGWSKGVDLVRRLDNGTYTIDDVTAHSDGKVIKVVDYMTGTNGKLDREAMGYGNYVMILHNAKYNDKYVVTLYAHLAKVDPNIREGVYIGKGQRLGVIGNTGNSSGAHLHLEVRLYGTMPVYTALHNKALFEWINPEPYLDADLPGDVLGFLDVAFCDKDKLHYSGWATYQNKGKQNVEIVCKSESAFKTFRVNADKPRDDVKKALSLQSDKVGFSGVQTLDLPNGKYTVTAYCNGIMLTNIKEITVKMLRADSYESYSIESKKYYRVKKSFKGKESKGAFCTWEYAYSEWFKCKDKGYHIYDDSGKQLD
jgi:hypothetical protein